jgi:hypothetical protein
MEVGRQACRGTRAGRWLAAAIAAVSAGLSHAALASEGGGQNVPTGAKTIEAALLPPPGSSEVFGYLLWFSSRSVRDDAGRSTVPGFHADLIASATQISHTWKPTFLGVNISSNFIFIIDYGKFKASGVRDENMDLSDLVIQPIVFTWAWGDWHFLTGPLFFQPVGDYNPTDPANNVVHYAHYQTMGYESAVTWLPNPWFELSLHPVLGVNFRNRRTGYRSGSLTGFDWGMMFRPVPSLRKFGLGLCGFYEHQFTNDTQSGVALPGRRITQDVVGPQMNYEFSPGTAVALKFEREAHAVNSARGNQVWFEFVLPLHL